MEKILLVLAVLIFAGAVYLFTRPQADKAVVTLPDPVTSTGTPTKEAAPSTDISIEEVKTGTGAMAEAGKKVSVQYRGTLTDGTEFDSSYKRNNQPLSFTVAAGQMIPGFDKGVQGMKVGGTRKITIPPSLGYGDRAVGSIPANSTLIFEVTLESVE